MDYMPDYADPRSEATGEPNIRGDWADVRWGYGAFRGAMTGRWRIGIKRIDRLEGSDLSPSRGGLRERVPFLSQSVTEGGSVG